LHLIQDYAVFRMGDSAKRMSSAACVSELCRHVRIRRLHRKPEPDVRSEQQYLLQLHRSALMALYKNVVYSGIGAKWIAQPNKD
jgi:hypothetical protein